MSDDESSDDELAALAEAVLAEDHDPEQSFRTQVLNQWPTAPPAAPLLSPKVC